MKPEPPLVPPPIPVTPVAGETPTASAQDTSGAAGSGSTNQIFLGVGRRPLPEYQLLAKLGQGGFGEVWKASGPGGFEVALKFLRLGEASGGTELKALHTVKGIRHPNLLSVFGVWEKDNFVIVAMELADRSLMDRLREVAQLGGPGIPAPELLEYMQDAARGLDHLNEKGIQHRDVKPHNLFIYGRGVKVADFGLAKVLERSLATASTKMTPAYAAPEFLNGQASRWSDQYSLAVTYCQLRGNRLPFSGTMMEILSGHMTRSPDLTMLPEAERPVVARALAKEPARRWPNCRSFVDALAVAMDAPSVTPRVVTPVEVGKKASGVKPPPARPIPTVELDDIDDLPEAPSHTVRHVPPPPPGGPRSSQRVQGGGASGRRLPRPPAPLPQQRSMSLLVVVLLAVLLLAGIGTGVGLWWFLGRTPQVAALKGTERTAPTPPPDIKPAAPTVPQDKPDPGKGGKPQDEPPPVAPKPPEGVLRLELLPTVQLSPGGTHTMTVRIERERCQGRVLVRLQDLPRGVTAEDAWVSADADTTRVTLRAAKDAPAGGKYVEVVASLGTIEANLSFRVEVESGDAPPPVAPPGPPARRPWPVERLLPDGTDMVMHLDCKDFLESDLARRQLREPLQQMLKDESVAQVLRNLEFDPLTDLFSLTMCFVDLRAKANPGGDVPWDGDICLIFKGKFAPAKIQAAFTGQTIIYRTHVIYEIKSANNPPLYLVLPDDGTALIATTQAQVTQVCDRIDQDRVPSYKLALQRALDQVRPRQTFWMAVAMPSFLRDQIRTAQAVHEAFSKITEATLHMTVTDSVRLEVEVFSDPDSAASLKTIIEQFKDFLTPNLIEDKELADEVGRMVRNMTVTASGKSLVLRLYCPARLAERLIDLAKQNAGR